MLETIQKLLALQDRDQRLHTFQVELKALPEEKRTKERLIAESAARLEKARVRAKEIEIEKKNLQLEASSKREQIQRYKTQQMQTRKNEEFTAFNNEIQGIEKLISSLEDRELGFMEEAESLKPQITTAEQTYASEKSKYEAQIASLVEKEANLKARIVELDASRATSVADLDEDLLDHYERLFKTKSGTAIVPLEHEVCTGCHMKVTTQTNVELKAGKTIVSCPQCGRILYLEA